MKISLVTALMVAGSMTVAFGAQEGGAQAPKPHSMEGCLAASGTEGTAFVVNNTAEKGPKVIGIVESTPNLKPHVGHKIEITGTAVPVADAEAMKPAPPKAPHYMKLTAIKMIAAACP